MQMIIKNRETRKVPKLKDILNDAINRQKKEQAAKRKDRENSKNITALLKESLKPKMRIGQYELVNDQTQKLIKSFDKNRTSIDALRTKLETVLRPVSARLRKPTYSNPNHLISNRINDNPSKQSTANNANSTIRSAQQLT